MTDGTTIARRAGACLFALAALWSGAANADPFSFFSRNPQVASIAPQQTSPAVTAPQAINPGTEAQLPEQLRRRIVGFPTREAPGTIIVDTPHTFLYYVLGNGKAIRYGIGVGRQGFTWSGVKSVVRKAEWPDWIPPEDMLKRQPYLPRFMAGGPGNPLGARAMYIGGTVYRIHGTNAPSTIGKHMSSGCIRMLNADVVDLFNRVNLGAKVIVLPQNAPTREARSYEPAKPQHAAMPAEAQQASAYAPPVSRTQMTWNSIRPASLY
jgi:lipoprotein-anchoring transpeptidase ErfK/SrfK